jgi:hypothetical protein
MDYVQVSEPAKPYRDRLSLGIFILCISELAQRERLLVRLIGRIRPNQNHIRVHDVAPVAFDPNLLNNIG